MPALQSIFRADVRGLLGGQGRPRHPPHRARRAVHQLPHEILIEAGAGPVPQALHQGPGRASRGARAGGFLNVGAAGVQLGGSQRAGLKQRHDHT
jgi:hypothetical protein